MQTTSTELKFPPGASRSITLSKSTTQSSSHLSSKLSSNSTVSALHQPISKQVTSPQRGFLENELRAALKLKKMRRFDDAEDKFREIIEKYNFVGIPSFHLAEMYRKDLDQFELSRGCYLEVLRIIPNHAKAYFGLAWIAERVDKKLQRAQALYRQAVQLDPKLSESFFNLGHLCFRQREYEDSVMYFERYLEDYPESLSSLRMLVTLYSRYIKNQPQALKLHLQSIVQIDPEDVTALNNLGTCHQQQGEMDLALQAYSKALEINPSYNKVWHNMGKVYRENLKDYENAMRCYLKSVEVNPNYAPSHNTLGLLYQKQFNNPTQSLYHFNRAIEIDPNSQVAHWNLGELYRDHFKDKKKARYHFQITTNIQKKYQGGLKQQSRLGGILAAAVESLDEERPSSRPTSPRSPRKDIAAQKSVFSSFKGSDIIKDNAEIEAVTLEEANISMSIDVIKPVQMQKPKKRKDSGPIAVSIDVIKTKEKKLELNLPTVTEESPEFSVRIHSPKRKEPPEKRNLVDFSFLTNRRASLEEQNSRMKVPTKANRFSTVENHRPRRFSLGQHKRRMATTLAKDKRWHFLRKDEDAEIGGGPIFERLV